MPTHEELFQAKLQRIKDSHRAEVGRTALLVIDMQHGFLDKGASLALPGATSIIPGIQRLVATARARGIPVIFTEYVYATNVPCLRGDPFGPEHLAAPPGELTGFGYPSNNCLIGLGAVDGPESAATIEALAPEPGELVIQGHTYDKNTVAKGPPLGGAALYRVTPRGFPETDRSPEWSPPQAGKAMRAGNATD